jgi:hypothetical protein
MAAAVGCTGCHDWSGKHSRRAVAGKCTGCHDAAYSAFLDEWTAGFDKEAGAVRDILKRAESALARSGRGSRAAEANGAVAQARQALLLVQKARGVHNPSAAEALLQIARKKAEEALARFAPR